VTTRATASGATTTPPRGARELVAALENGSARWPAPWGWRPFTQQPGLTPWPTGANPCCGQCLVGATVKLLMNGWNPRGRLALCGRARYTGLRGGLPRRESGCAAAGDRLQFLCCRAGDRPHRPNLRAAARHWWWTFTCATPLLVTGQWNWRAHLCAQRHQCTPWPRRCPGRRGVTDEAHYEPLPHALQGDGRCSVL